MSRGRKNGNSRLVNQKYATVDDILPALQAKHATLLAASRLRYETGKEPDPQLHDDMLLISSVIRKLARYGENIMRAERAKRKWKRSSKNAESGSSACVFFPSICANSRPKCANWRQKFGIRWFGNI